MAFPVIKNIYHVLGVRDFPGGSAVENLPTNAGDGVSISGSGRSPGVGNDNPTPALLPGKSHGQRSLADCSLWGYKEWDMTKQLNQSNWGFGDQDSTYAKSPAFPLMS